MFIVIDGVDGAGKNTQIEMLSKYLDKNGKKYDLYDFPQYNKESSFMVREYLKGTFGNISEITPQQASLLYAIDRFYVKNDILKSIKEKDFVLSSRYTTSNIIHQAMKKENKDEQEEIINWIKNTEYNILGIPQPDKVIFLDMHIDISWKLINERGGGKGQDIHELDYDYLKNMYFRTLDIINDLGWTIVRCYENNKPKTREEIHQNIIKLLK